MAANMMGAPQTTSRRQVLGAAVAIGSAVALAPGTKSFASAQDEKRVSSPDWAFAIHTIEVPYTGMLEQEVPQQQLGSVATPGAASAQVVAFEVEVDNASNQPLDFRPSDIRLRLATGVEYRGGSIIGTEPRISSRVLNRGERSRGWVWFAIPSDALPVELVYLAPSPEFRLPL